MDVPIEVPGLDSIIPHLAGGQLLVAESGPDPAKSYFLRKICITGLRLEQPVTFVTSRGKDEIHTLFHREGGFIEEYSETLHVREEDTLGSLDGGNPPSGILAVDSFTLLTLDLGSTQLAKLLREFRSLCLDKGTTVLLATDRGMQAPSSEAVTNHLSDCVVQFHAKEGPEGVVRFLRIPKWTDGKFVDRNIYYDYDGKRMAIDLRRRVI